MTLFIRKYALTIGDQIAADDDGTEGEALQVNALDIEFEVHKNNTAEPDFLKVKMYNAPLALQQAAQEEGAALQLQCGYQDSEFSDEAGVIFQGLIRKTDILQNCSNAQLEVEAGDSDPIFRCARTVQSFPPGTDVTKIAVALLRAMRKGAFDKTGLDVKIRQAKNQLESLMPKKADEKGRTTTAKGLAFNGPSHRIFSDFLSVFDLVWVLQDGIIKISERDTPSEQFPEAVVLSPTTGLIGKPQIGEDGVMKARSLLQADLKPFAQVEIRDSDFADGFYNIEKVKHIGKFDGKEWYSDIEAVRIQ